MIRLLFIILFCAVAAFAGNEFDLNKDMALSKANQNFRSVAAGALEKDELEQLAQIERDAAAYADSVGYTKALFQDNEVILVRFLQKDYAFISDIDSISKYDYSPSTYDRFGDVLKAYFRKKRDSGELEGMFAQIPNASDRAFARIVIARCINVSRQELSEMIEKSVDDLTNEKQLQFLVGRYWHKEGFDLETYACVASGVTYNMMLGDVSKSLDDGIGINADMDYTYKNFFFELRIAIEMNEYKTDEDLNYVGGGFGIDIGRSIPIVADHLHLRPYVGVGFGFSELRWSDEDFVDNVYPTFGAGAIADVFFNSTTSMRFGLRLRGGIRTFSAGPRDISSGANFYTQLAFVILETKYKEFKFEYPERRQ